MGSGRARIRACAVHRHGDVQMDTRRLPGVLRRHAGVHRPALLHHGERVPPREPRGAVRDPPARAPRLRRRRAGTGGVQPKDAALDDGHHDHAGECARQTAEAGVIGWKES